MFHVPGLGPDQLNRCEVGAESSLLTCSHLCSHISWYNTIGFLLTIQLHQKMATTIYCPKFCYVFVSFQVRGGLASGSREICYALLLQVRGSGTHRQITAGFVMAREAGTASFNK